MADSEASPCPCAAAMMGRLEREHVSTPEAMEMRLPAQLCALLGRAYELLMSDRVSDADRQLAQACMLLAGEMRTTLAAFEPR